MSTSAPLPPRPFPNPPSPRPRVHSSRVCFRPPTTSTATIPALREAAATGRGAAAAAAPPQGSANASPHIDRTHPARMALKGSAPAGPEAVAPATAPQQRVVDGEVFPLILSPAAPDAFARSLSDTDQATDQLVNGHAGPPNGQANADADHKLQQQPSQQAVAVADWVRANRAWVEQQWQRHGAVVLRGFPLASAADFNAVVEAFGYEELPYVGGAAPRTKVVGRVFTSNESPPDQKIPFHHEMAQVPEFPSRLFFFCEVPAVEGGETPLLLSHEVTTRMEAQHPDFVRQLRDKGLRYVRVLGEGDDASSAIGRGWKSTFLTDDRAVAEEKAAKLGVSLDWQQDGSVRTVSGPLPAVRVDERTGREAWFNSLVAAFTGWNDARNEGSKAVTFGDGTLLPAEAVLDCAQLMQEVAVALPWQAGDVVLVDNHTVQHARREFLPPRRVLASLVR